VDQCAPADIPAAANFRSSAAILKSAPAPAAPAAPAPVPAPAEYPSPPPPPCAAPFACARLWRRKLKLKSNLKAVRHILVSSA